MSIYDRLYVILNGFLDFDEGEVIYPEYHLADDLQFTEPEMLQLLDELNEEFGLQLTADKLPGLMTVGEIMDYVSKNT